MKPFPAIISKIETMSDKTLRLRIDTQEMTNEEKSDIFSLHDKFVYLFFGDNLEYKPSFADLPPIVLEDNEKSPSERLRAVLFVYWKEKGIKEDFDVFYRKYINKVIESVKEKLT